MDRPVHDVPIGVLLVSSPSPVALSIASPPVVGPPARRSRLSRIQRGGGLLEQLEAKYDALEREAVDGIADHHVGGSSPVALGTPLAVGKAIDPLSESCGSESGVPEPAAATPDDPIHQNPLPTRDPGTSDYVLCHVSTADRLDDFRQTVSAMVTHDKSFTYKINGLRRKNVNVTKYTNNMIHVHCRTCK